jgi:hypothetical protein
MMIFGLNRSSSFGKLAWIASERCELSFHHVVTSTAVRERALPVVCFVHKSSYLKLDFSLIVLLWTCDKKKNSSVEALSAEHTRQCPVQI